MKCFALLRSWSNFAGNASLLLSNSMFCNNSGVHLYLYMQATSAGISPSTATILHLVPPSTPVCWLYLVDLGIPGRLESAHAGNLYCKFTDSFGVVIFHHPFRTNYLQWIIVHLESKDGLP